MLIEAARFGCYARPIAIEAIYTEDLRESHYRAGADTLRIVRMVAGKLLRNGLSPLGLLRALGILPHPETARRAAGENDSDSPS